MKDTAMKKPTSASTPPTVCNPLWTKNPNSAKLFEKRAKIIPTGKHTLQPITINLLVGEQAAENRVEKGGGVRHFVPQDSSERVAVEWGTCRRCLSPSTGSLGKGGVMLAPARYTRTRIDRRVLIVKVD